MNRAEIQTRIDQIQTILDGGLETVTRGGRSMSYNFDQLRIQLDRYQRALNGNSMRRVVYNPRQR